MFNLAKLKFDDIFENRLPEEEVREYLIELYERGETVAEIAGAVSAMRDHLIPLPADVDLCKQAIDIVGTGGDKSYSFNISTTVSLLLPSCGSYVAKHGNRSVTSKSGSSDMLEALGFNLNLSLENSAKLFEQTGFVFMHAANHHPAMKYITPIRKTISHRTIFNIIGPLSNPAYVKKQFLGVYPKELIGKITEALNMLDTKKALVVSSNDGMDEISISDITYANSLENGKIEEFIIDPQEFGFKLAPKESIVGGDGKENANITRGILSGEITDSKLDIVLLNAAAALIVDEKASDFKEGIEIAREAIKSKKAFEKLEEIIKVSNSF
ncbi:anthranilate phosphoribosyltransferase [Malaciobacter mytili]|uniref:Anthranilate phosphoribosyltransferase n=1 Tax=Malaciobacter mytili LMG 24559 TaxID=1032238 RepID=A0AAX2AEE4_9BACT|nr:anthranilate phosphoribosyltransferase [Malaciobacter mytili]AXH14991.1 anthranilate phosphoribosyltransferase / anthranilate synthase component II, TrpD subunit [Malaciobacter mytili LMG 24559]RXK15005.1 anthranilate phosphoribosyltransferase [Malaciobacter mytili LMG 24559]